MKSFTLEDRQVEMLGVSTEMLGPTMTFANSHLAAWDVELGIRRYIEPMTDDEVLAALEDLSWFSNEERAVENPDCPPYDPKLGL